MTDVIRNLLYAEPFQPFVIESSDGQQYPVKHPDYVAISPKGGRITVYADEEHFAMLSALHIVAVEPIKAGSRRR
ncbi:MAG TPA: hypothetical protein VGM54_12240 [Chthoniobacter sp.]|jgi:hypothetical protein